MKISKKVSAKNLKAYILGGIIGILGLIAFTLEGLPVKSSDYPESHITSGSKISDTAAKEVKAPPQSLQKAAGVVFIDRETGKITSTPTEDYLSHISKAARTSLSTSHEGLKVEPAPGGGYMVYTKGRFRNIMKATRTSNGQIKVECLPQYVDQSKADTDTGLKSCEKGKE